MRDGIPKGTGNSRLIKSNDTIPIDFTAFRNQLISTGIPIDLLLNEEGWNILGDFLRKAFFLADDTAAALGLTEENATVNNGLMALSPLLGLAINRQAYMNVGTFTFTAPKDGWYDVIVVGTGGGVISSSAGAGGGFALKRVYLTKGQQVPVTVGNLAPNSGVYQAESSSFGSYVSATGGAAGTPGDGVGGDINITGGRAGSISGGSALSSPGQYPNGPGAGRASQNPHYVPGCVIVSWV